MTRRAHATPRPRSPPDDRSQFLVDTDPQTVRDRVAQGGSFTFTTRILDEEGQLGVVKTRFVPYDEENQIYIMARTNVTDLLRDEETKNALLRDALTVAQQANNAKSDFLSSMSHDIRTPMNAIMGMCELAIQDEDDRAQVHESLQTIQSSSQLLLTLVNNILDMNRIESGKMVADDRPFSITGEANETIASFRALAGQYHQTLTVDIDVQHDCCVGDVGHVHSAIDNILSNALKYTPEGGRIAYRVSERASDSPGIGMYRFEVADNGIGMDEETRARLFEPFYRGQAMFYRTVEGTGLGLSIAKAIVDLKGGTIDVDTHEGVGTTFVVELPLRFSERAGDEPRRNAQQNAVDSFDLSGLRLLLCEDQPINQVVAQRILEKAGARVTIASDGKEGLDDFANSPQGSFDAIIMDVRMPRMDGYEATRAIRASAHPQASSIPIIAMTAYAFVDDIRKSHDAGMNAHLAKPIEPDQMYETILACIHEQEGSTGR